MGLLKNVVKKEKYGSISFIKKKKKSIRSNITRPNPTIKTAHKVKINAQ